MAVVYDVFDRVSGRRMAMKRPQSSDSPERDQRARDLFAREYHTLSQLAHPRIVEVYDYGVDELGPYYTMELLDGGDLEQSVPCDYKQVCAIARDICSALSLLHSRRIVHRDISPRNIRCTSDGLAKLIDFGAMTRMGVIKELVGTPVYCAPEVLNLQPLDGRADLFALGATLYYVLTGHHAFPVRDFASLPNAWKFGLARPSELVPGIPSALDDLVLDLLQLEAANRPANAAEVMERISVIEGRTLQEHLLVAQSYLATPAFVGREMELARVRSKAMRVQRGHGSALVASGEAGVGRTRFLDQSVLSAKLLGLMVVRADGDDAVTGEYGIVRRLLQQLRQLLPDVVSEAARADLPVLGHEFPELLQGQVTSLRNYADVNALRPQLQDALRRLFLAIAEQVPLVLVVDDLHAADEPSLATLGVLARAITDAGLLILASVEQGVKPPAAVPFQLFLDAASELSLQNLTAAETDTLLASVFGASPQLEQLGQRLYALSAGAPRDLMRLAQHLVDSGLVRYQSGAWSLPEQLAAAELPSSIAHILMTRVLSLEESASELGCALALCPEKTFSFEDCLSLSEHGDQARLMADLSKLTSEELLRANGDRYILADRAWIGILASARTREDLAELHLRLARVFEARPGEDFRRAQHLMRAGEKSLALDVFVAHAIASRKLTDRDPEAFFAFVRSQPADWLQTYEEALELCRELNRPKADEYALRVRLGGLQAVVGLPGNASLATLVTQLEAACGLADWQRLGDAVEPAERIKRALELARARFEAAPEHERVLEPFSTLRELTGAMRFMLGASAPNFDVAAVRALPSLAPFIPLSPSLRVIEQLVVAVHARMTGHSDEARRLYIELLEAIAAPGHAGLDESAYEYTRLMLLSSLGLTEAALGLPEGIERVEELESNPLFIVNAMQLRMQHHLWQGDAQAAHQCRKQVEVLRLQNTARQTFENTYLVWQIMAQVATEDLTRIKHSLAELAPLAERFVGWRPVVSFGRAEYLRIRGDYTGALELLNAALTDLQPGDHQVWVQLAAAKIRCLHAAGRSEEAVVFGSLQLAAAERAQLGPTARQSLLLPLCVAQAKVGNPAARSNAEAALARCQQLGATGLNLVLAYEARAWVAAYARDVDGYAEAMGMCEKLNAKSPNPALLAKLQKLKREAQRAKLIASSLKPVRNIPAAVGEGLLKSRIHSCATSTERANTVLSLLAEESGASEGYLYAVTTEGPSFVASFGSGVPDAKLHVLARDFVDAEINARDASTDSAGTIMPTGWIARDEVLYRPVLLSHYIDSGCIITGLAVFVVAAGQPFAHPTESANSISRMLQELGDSVGVVVSSDY